MTNWYNKTSEETLKEMSSSPRGLSKQEAGGRLEHYGRNSLEQKRSIHPLKIFFNQFKDILILILIVAGFVSLIVSNIEHQSPVEAILIFIIIFAIAAIGFFNEYKAEKTVEALKKMASRTCKVKRDGQVISIDVDQVVPGDIVVLEEGQKVPADIRLIEANSLQVDEAALTGESLPVEKEIGKIDKNVALGDQFNMLFSGTLITSGKGQGVVVGTGNKTELGKIAGLVSEVEEEETPIQKKLDALGKKLAYLVGAISVIIFIVILVAHPDAEDITLASRLIYAFTVSVALAVAAIPEGLSFVIRISLALGARRMADKKALVRKLSAVESLGSTDIICTDKTGTLTKGEMTVRKASLLNKDFDISGSGYSFKGDIKFRGNKIKDSDLETLLRVGMLCNNAEIRDEKVFGDPTEGALLVSAIKYGLDENHKYKEIDEIPFSSDRKMMSTVHKQDKYYISSKGAPDVLLEKCSHILSGGKKRKLTKALKKQILDKNTELSKQAMRVLGFAYKEQTAKPTGDYEKELVFIGLQAMMDPPREEVKQVMHSVHVEAGMRVIMITGDYIETARAIAKEIGIEGEAISGEELDKLSQKEFEAKVEDISIYARVDPKHKIRIVEALKKHGHQVAMTGDGVNDAPAIKAADIGIAMGITGTDAAKEAADMILLDDKFLTIISAIEEGRGIFDNMRKFVSYLLGANISEVLVVLGGILIFRDPLLTAIQLLFINIVTDGLPAISLGSDPAEKGIMRYKPEHFQGEIVGKKDWIEMFTFGVVMSAIVMIQFYLLSQHQPELSVASAIFSAVVIYELVRVVILRTGYKIPWFSNPWLSISLALSIGILVFVLAFTPLAELFEVTGISVLSWVYIATASVGLFVIMKISNRIIYSSKQT